MSEKARRALGPDGAARLHGVFKRAARDAHAKSLSELRRRRPEQVRAREDSPVPSLTGTGVVSQ